MHLSFNLKPTHDPRAGSTASEHVFSANLVVAGQGAREGGLHTAVTDCNLYSLAAPRPTKPSQSDSAGCAIGFFPSKKERGVKLCGDRLGTLILY